MPHIMNQDSEMKSCIDACIECSRTCLETIAHCLNQEGVHKEHQHIALLQVCADICQVSGRAMLLGSDQHMAICRACADVCRVCAEDCRQFQDDSFMTQCGEICQKCAESCEGMSVSHGKVKKQTEEIRPQV